MEREPPLLELFEDKWKDLKSIRDFIRLPVLYHPLPGESNPDASPRDISALKIDAVVEEGMRVHELDEIRARLEMLQKSIPPISLGDAASSAPSQHVLHCSKKHKAADAVVEQKRARK